MYTSAETSIQTIIEIITSVRNTRAQWNIKPNENIRCDLSSKSKTALALLQENDTILKRLARIDELTIGETSKEEHNTATAIVENVKVSIPLGDLIDIDAEKNRINKQLVELEQASKNLSNRLSSANFLEKAPQDVVEKEKKRLKSMTVKTDELKKVIVTLKR